MTAAPQLPSLLDDLSLLENKEDWTVDDLATLPKDLRYVSLAVDRRNEPRPDVVVARMAAGLRSPAPIQAAMLAVEVISPTSHFRDMDAKKKLFAAAAVGSYWVIDPTFEKGVVLTEFRLGDNGAYDTVTNTDKIFVTEVPYRVTIDLPALTEIREDHRRAEAGE
jgi:Uma2 family endonuclease